MESAQRSWTPDVEIGDLWMEIQRAAPSADGLLLTVGHRIRSFDPTLWDAMQQPSHRARRDSYLVRYGLPVAELYGWPENSGDLLTDSLALHFFWALCWRRMDDVLDSLQPEAKATAEMAAAVCRATRVHILVCERFGLRWSDDVIHQLELLCSTADEERQHAVPKDQIWRRATPFLISGRSILRLDAKSEAIYRAYINIDGLSHDIHDLLSDIRLGIRSLPATWFAELDRDQAFRRDIVELWFHRARTELIDAITDLRRIAPIGRFPILDILVYEHSKMAESLGT